MAVADSNRKMPQIPQELYRRIMTSHLHLLSNTWDPALDVHRFTYVSKTWRHEAECIIYDRVNVRDFNLLLFCRTVIDRPDLAKRVRVLNFCTAGHHARRPGELEIVKRMFSLVENLKDLEFWSVSLGNEWDVKGDIICQFRDWDVLMDVPFKLDRLACSFFWDEDIFGILEQQPALRQFESLGDPCWSKDWVHTGPFVPEAVLANCKALRIYPYMTHTFVRLPPVTHLHLELYQRSPVEEAYGAEEVALFGNNLRVLMINRNICRFRDVEYLSPAQIIKRFAGKTPKLSVLGMIDQVLWSPKDNKEVLQAVAGNFPNLKVFIWGPFSSNIKFQEADGWSSSEYDGYSSFSDEGMSTFYKIERFALEMVKEIPTLSHFIVAGTRRETYALEKRWIEGGYYLKVLELLFNRANSFSYIDPDRPYDLLGRHILYDGRFSV